MTAESTPCRGTLESLNIDKNIPILRRGEKKKHISHSSPTLHLGLIKKVNTCLNLRPALIKTHHKMDTLREKTATVAASFTETRSSMSQYAEISLRHELNHERWKMEQCDLLAVFCTAAFFTQWVRTRLDIGGLSFNSAGLSAYCLFTEIIVKTSICKHQFLHPGSHTFQCARALGVQWKYLQVDHNYPLIRTLLTYVTSQLIVLRGSI